MTTLARLRKEIRFLLNLARKASPSYIQNERWGGGNTLGLYATENYTFLSELFMHSRIMCSKNKPVSIRVQSKKENYCNYCGMRDLLEDYEVM